MVRAAPNPPLGQLGSREAPQRPHPRASGNLRNTTTLQLGDYTGSRWWDSEYDVEFSWKNGLPTEAYRPGAPRPSPSTPRSMKKGFVLGEDYEALGGRFAAAQAGADQLAGQLAAERGVTAAMRGGERALVAAVQNEHASLEVLQQQLDRVSRSLSSLLGDVEHSRSLMEDVLKVDSASGNAGTSGHQAEQPSSGDRLAALEQQLAQLTGRLHPPPPSGRPHGQPPAGAAAAVISPRSDAEGEPDRPRPMTARQRRLVARNTSAVTRHVVRQDQFCHDCYDDLRGAAHSLSVKFLRT